MNKDKISMPHVFFECGGKQKTFDLELEKINLNHRVNNDFLNPKYREYITYLKKFFKSDDPKVLMKRAFKSKVVPVFCDVTNSIFLIDSKSGNTIKKINSNNLIAKKLLKIAKELIS